MKILITSTGKTLDSEVDPRLGRAKNFIVFDTDSEQVQALDNTQNVNAAQGAGIQASQTIAQTGAEFVLTGNCGPNAFRTLQAAGIKVITGMQGTVREAIEKFKQGDFSEAEQANVQGHWT